MTSMKRRREITARSIGEQAAEWLLILETPSERERAEFVDWLRESPKHVGAFLRASAVDEMVAEADPEKSIELEMGPFPDGVEVGREEEELEKAAGQRRFGVSRHLVRWFALAACFLVVLLFGGFVSTHHITADRWSHYTTAVGEQRVLTLEDGSVVYLGPKSRVDVLFVSDERRLRLESGQAAFRVAHDVARPFRVHSGRTVVQAVGTAFDVRQVRDESVVSVIEGTVQVSHQQPVLRALTMGELEPVQLIAGQELRVPDNGTVSAPVLAPVDYLQEWKERRLTFVNETLFAIAEEFNRYNRSPKIHVEDQRAGELRYAAAFDADDPESLVAVLDKNQDLVIERRADEIVIRSK